MLNDMNDLNQIAEQIFTGATCQADIDARVGDFIACCAAGGVVASPGVAIFEPTTPVPVLLCGWHFLFRGRP